MASLVFVLLDNITIADAECTAEVCMALTCLSVALGDAFLIVFQQQYFHMILMSMRRFSRGLYLACKLIWCSRGILVLSSEDWRLRKLEHVIRFGGGDILRRDMA